MGFQDVALLPPELVLHHMCNCGNSTTTPHSLKIVADMKPSGPAHVLRVWLGVSKGMLPVKYLHSNKNTFCVS